jgi:D-alanine-D-alanine ligase
MRVALLYNAPRADADADEADVLQQMHVVSEALAELGHTFEPFACTLDLDPLTNHLRATRPELAFNLVESLGGTDRLVTIVPTLLEGLRLPYTGCGASALARTADKVDAKRALIAADLPTPAWLTADSGETGCGRYIVKARAEHASVGMGDDAVVDVKSGAALRDRLRACADGPELFAERFVPGREFNLAMLDGPDGVEVLPPAEIDFSAFPAHKPRIVGWAAKWDPASFEYHATPRRFDFDAADAPLLARLEDLAAATWRTFDLRGLARVDFRVGPDGSPWILEVNANPCLSPDAGFAAAARRAGLSLTDVVARLLTTAGLDG